jgi:hypothetical protein
MDEQYIDPTKVVSYNFFSNLAPALTQSRSGRAGSNILPGLEPTVQAFVLTLEY